MSADNGVYILKTPCPPIKQGNTYVYNEGYEYRVAHCQAIENIDYSDLYLPVYFGKSEVFLTEEEAWNKAQQIHDELGWTEYGICLLQKKFYPKITIKAAKKALDYYVVADDLLDDVVVGKTDDRIELLANTVVDSWDLDTLISFAVEQLVIHYNDCDEGFQDDWQFHFGII